MTFQDWSLQYKKIFSFYSSMENVTPFDWSRLFLGKNEWLFYAEIGFRVLVIYIFAALLMRYMGKRGRKEITPFEHVVIIALGSATGDVLFYPEVPLLYAFLVISLIIFFSQIFAFVQYRFPVMQRFLDGTPRVLIRNGRVLDDALKKEKMSLSEVHSMLRVHGISNIEDVALAILELDGSLSAFTQKEVSNGKNSILFQDLNT